MQNHPTINQGCISQDDNYPHKTSSKSKYFTDSLSKLDKNKRKLIAQVMVIVSKHTDEATLNKIKAEIEKEFR